MELNRLRKLHQYSYPNAPCTEYLPKKKPGKSPKWSLPDTSLNMKCWMADGNKSQEPFGRQGWPWGPRKPIAAHTDFWYYWWSTAMKNGLLTTNQHHCTFPYGKKTILIPTPNLTIDVYIHTYQVYLWSISYVINYNHTFTAINWRESSTGAPSRRPSGSISGDIGFTMIHTQYGYWWNKKCLTLYIGFSRYSQIYKYWFFKYKYKYKYIYIYRYWYIVDQNWLVFIVNRVI